MKTEKRLPHIVVMLGDGLVAVLVPIFTASRPLTAIEERVVGDGATLRRRQEVVAGRQAGHAALDALGLRCESIGQGSKGQPLFPNGTCGSIGHSQEVAVALVGMNSTYGSVGVDIDDTKPLGEEAAKDVTWEAETRRVGRALGPFRRDQVHSFTFAAKEAVYKCQFPLTGRDGLVQTQVRLLPRRDQQGILDISGWRVAPSVANQLARISVSRHMVGSTVLAVAVAAAC